MDPEDVEKYTSQENKIQTTLIISLLMLSAFQKYFSLL